MAKNTVIVSVLGDTRDLNSKLGGTGSTFNKFAAAAAVAAAATVAALGAITVKAVRSASDLEQNMGALEAVFKDNSAQMAQWATDAAGALGLAKSEYAGLATILGSQMKNMGVAADQLGGQTHELIGLGADLAAQFGGSTSDAVSALSSLLRGERDPIERYGVSINEAAVKAKMAEMGLAGLTGEAEKNAKLSATLALLYDQTADAQGAFARESTTLAGAQQRLAAGTENLYATLGTSLLPAVTAVTAAFGEMVNRLQESEWFAALTENLANASSVFADFVFGLLNGTESIDFGSMLSGLLPAIVTGIQTAASWIANGGLQPILANIANGRNALMNAAITLFQAIAAALPGMMPALMHGLLTFIRDVVAFIVDSAPVLLDAAVQSFTSLVDSLAIVLPQMVIQLVQMIPTLVEAILSMVPLILQAAIQLFTALVDAIPIILPPLIGIIVATLPVLMETILSMLPSILQAAIGLFTALVESIPIILPVLLNAIIDLLPELVRTVLSLIPALLQGAIELFKALVTAVPRILPDLIPALIALLPEIIGAIIGMIPDLIQAGIDLISGLVSGLWQAAGSVGEALLGIISGAVNGFLAFLGIQSPSRLFAGFGKDTVQGLVQGLTQNARLVDGAMADLSDRVVDGFDATLSTPEIDSAFDSSASGTTAATPVTYEIHMHTLTATAEAGRVIAESLDDYKRFGGRQ